jgi:NAD(P)-dependent dehydrogenase (short-subunit alcohol dehydrogenase family)
MRVLITGCSTGIGRAAAEVLAARGHEVVATARRVESLRGLAVAARLALDVDDDASVRAAVAAAGPLDALVNNAGRSSNGPVEKFPAAAAREIMETNFWGVVRMIQAVLPGMRERGRGGAIVNVSSVSGRVGAPLAGFYTASKYALEGLSESLKLEVGHFGIRVALVEPGFFETALRGKSVAHGVDGPPYDELSRVWNGVDGKLLGGARPGPEAVAHAIADAVEGKDERLRIPVGKDAETVLGTRAKLDDAAFEAAMRQVLKLDW